MRRFEKRANCPGATSGAFAKRVAKVARLGTDGDHTTKGRASGGAKHANASRRAARKQRMERKLNLDKFGWFRETRRRERLAYVREVLPLLHAAGFCRAGMRALLHCSNSLLYHVADEENMLSGLDLLSLRRHGSRAGLPPMAALASRECCACGCLACIPVGHLQRQFGWWKECNTDREKLLCLSTRILFSDAAGQAVPRCWMSCFLQFGLSKHSYSAAQRFIAATAEEQRLILTHGLQGRAPANKMDSELAQLALAHFRTWTTSDPSGNSHVRPANLEVDGMPALM